MAAQRPYRQRRQYMTSTAHSLNILFPFIEVQLGRETAIFPNKPLF